MNILIVTPHFYPENFRINDFAEAFTKRGHEISVLTGVPDYPEESFMMVMVYLRKIEKYTMV